MLLFLVAIAWLVVAAVAGVGLTGCADKYTVGDVDLGLVRVEIERTGDSLQGQNLPRAETRIGWGAFKKSGEVPASERRGAGEAPPQSEGGLK